MAREKFTFFRSYYEALEGVDPKIRTDILTAIIEYALDGKEPGDLKSIGAMAFKLVRPTIDRSIELQETRSRAGAKGGRAKGDKGQAESKEKQTESKNKQTESKNKQTESKQKRNKDIGIKRKISEKEKTDDDGGGLVEMEGAKAKGGAMPAGDPTLTLDEMSVRLMGHEGDLWREEQTRRNGVRDFALAMGQFKAHVIANGKDGAVTSLGEYKRYFNVAARFFLTDESRRENGGQWIAALIRTSDGQTYVRQYGQMIPVGADTPKPPTALHAWNGREWEHV
ncbi:MAG: DUF6291 domain-containing protein [Pseudoflavonifractor sp.]|nr:DUF6291 domain-containing protein [Alloprevotella sp.]MCM1117628.1 DUF6291 domain-containing protein [Pseudoflavonifractor sp.]